MNILNTSTWVLLLFDVAGVWLLVRPSDLVNLWSAHRVPASDFDRFLARLLGVIMLSAQVTHWGRQARNTSAESILHWLSITFWFGAVVFLGYHFGWQWAFWQCPRCGYSFKGIHDPFFPKRCHYCDLPRWAESPDQ